VQFHWDQEGQYDENSSCWIRVNQGWAGKGWGHISIPRIGQEVIVSFINSDPDRPLVTGGVYNAQQTVPYPLPAGQNKSTLKSNTTPGGGGSNEIRLDDSKGQEEMFIHAQKDQNEVVENNQTMTVKVNRTKTINGTETTTVKGDRTETVSEGHESVAINTGNRTVEVKTGNDTLIVGTGNRVVQVKSNDNVTIEGNKTLSVVGNISILKGGASGDGANGILIEAAGENITLKTGASSIILHNDGRIEIKGDVVAINGDTKVAIHGGEVESKADKSHNTSGNIVVSDGSATNTVKGGTVLLNP
jgi:type VI secretion system secreted protein VgrG